MLEVIDPCAGSDQLVTLLLETATAALQVGADIDVVKQLLRLASHLSGQQMHLNGGE